MSFYRVLLAILVLAIMFPPPASADVRFFDGIAVVGVPVMLRAETRGRFFARGGEMVEFIVNGEGLGAGLSGGDGVAFREFVPQGTGLHEVEVLSGERRDKGYLLCMRRGQGLVFVDVENGLFENVFAETPRAGSRKALEEIIETGGLVYLSTEMTGLALAGRRLGEGGFPPAPLMRWDGGRVFHEAVEKGLKIRAVIGKPDVAESAGEFGPKALSFHEAEGVEQVDDWSEIPGKF
jgi:hypothetical protein